VDTQLSISANIIWALLGAGIFFVGIFGRGALKYPILQAIMTGIGASLIIFALYCLAYELFNKKEPEYFLVGLTAIVLGIIIAFICYRYLYRIIMTIVVHGSESKSKSGNSGHKHYIEVPFTIKTTQIPVHVAKVILHFHTHKLKAIEPPFDLNNTIQTQVCTFVTSNEIGDLQSIKSDDKFQLTVLALGREWGSNEFTMPIINVTIGMATSSGYGNMHPAEDITTRNDPTDNNDVTTKDN